MALNKYSHKSDEIGNLYRAAFYLAKGSEEVGLGFLSKSGKTFKGLKTNTEKDRLFWAEKILDEYLKLKLHFALGKK
jgi:hypothetical protein